MKILWMTNYPLPFIAQKAGLTSTVNEGWLTGLAELLLEEGAELICCSELEEIREKVFLNLGNVTFYGFPSRDTGQYNDGLKDCFSRVLKKEAPDIVHIMGSEFPHSYSMYEACVLNHIENRCVVSIQGLISRIAQSYDLGIEAKYKKKRFLWDLLVKDSILLNKKDFERRGDYEKRLLKKVSNVVGRTSWDRLCVKQMNPEGCYYHCNEILRDVFYRNRWKADGCVRHSVMISQATYPVKGFHILLKAAGMLVKKYPDLKLFVPSHTVYSAAMKRPRFLNSDYANYVVTLIKKNGLEENIEFLGSLDAENMCRAYLSSQIFVCPSTIENSSNSLGEAMLLGMPVIAAYVGGLGSMMTHGEEGLFFPLEEEYMLAAYIELLFEDKELAVRLGERARVRALETHNREKNVQDMLACYQKLMEENGKK